MSVAIGRCSYLSLPQFHLIHAVFLLFGPGVPVIAGGPVVRQTLTAEVETVVQSRFAAIKSVEADGERLDLSENWLRPLTQDQLKTILETYANSPRSELDRKHLYHAVSTKAETDVAGEVRRISFIQDGSSASAQVSHRYGHHRVVRDGRAIVTVFGDQHQPSDVTLRAPSSNVRGPVELEDFSKELRGPAYLTFLRRFDPATVNPQGNLDLTSEDPLSKSFSHVEISREDGIVILREYVKPDKKIIVRQVGRLATSSGFSFPAVCGRFEFDFGRLHRVKLVVPIAVKVNQPVSQAAFLVAGRVRTRVTDDRDGQDVTLLLDRNVDDLVDFADRVRSMNCQTAN